MLTGAQEVNGALHDLEISFNSLTVSRNPYFQEAFEALCQYQALNQRNGSSDEVSRLNLLANRPTKSIFTFEEFSTGADLIACVQRVTGIRMTNPTLVPMRNTLPILLIQKL